MTRGFVIVAALTALPGWADAQRGADVVARAVRAYQSLDFETAAGLLRRALAPPLADSLGDAERTRALTYLGATERYRGRRDSALAVFRRLILLDPRHRLDPMVFPPEVTLLFDDVRRRVKAVLIRVPADTEIGLDGRLTAWLYATSPHDVTVAVARGDARLLRVLYDGPIGDSLDVQWNGRDSTGAPAPGARLWLIVTSRGGEGTRIVQLPLRVELARADTLPHPTPLPAAQLLPERADRGTALRSLAGGLALGAAALALPQVVAPGERSSGTRFAVAGVLGVSGVVGFLSQRPGRALPANVATNQARRDAWRRQLDAVTRENADRLRSARLRFHAGPPVTIERERSSAGTRP